MRGLGSSAVRVLALHWPALNSLAIMLSPSAGDLCRAATTACPRLPRPSPVWKPAPRSPLPTEPPLLVRMRGCVQA
jgi:hypothetical protein